MIGFSSFKTLSSVLALFLLCAVAATAQEPANSRSDDELKRISDVIDRAWKEVNTAGQARATSANRERLGHRYSILLWQYRNEHPRTAAGMRATVAALNLMLAAGRKDEAMAMAETLPLDDPAWDRVIQILWRESDEQGEYSAFIKKAESVLAVTRDKNARTRSGIFLGQAYWKQDQLDRAKAVFQRVIDEAPDSEDAEWASGNIYEITTLGLGQPCPLFQAKELNGGGISLADFRGKIVLLKFWATW